MAGRAWNWLRLRWRKWPKSSRKWLLAGTNGASAQRMSRAGRVLQPGFSPAAGVQRLVPPRAPSADISLVYLPSSHRPYITKGTTALLLSSHPSRPLTLQVFRRSLVAAVATAAVVDVPLFVWIAKLNNRKLDFTELASLGKIDCINILKPETAPDLWR